MKHTHPTINDHLELAIILGSFIILLIVAFGILFFVQEYQRRAKIKFCKHEEGWVNNVSGREVEITQGQIDVTDIGFGNIVCKECKKSLAEINF